MGNEVEQDLFDPAAEEVNPLPPTSSDEAHKRQSIVSSLLAAISPRYRNRVRKKPAGLPKLPLPSTKRFQASLAETSFDPKAPKPPKSTVLYLAYGSNLCFETFQGRRGIRPLSAVNVLVPGLKLTFDLPGFAYNEPCFANTARLADADVSPAESRIIDESAVLIEKPSSSDPGSLVGVVYEVTAEDYEHIIATEGPTYADTVVTCHALPTPNAVTPSEIPKSPFKAHTLLAPASAVRHSPSGLPAQASLRYLTLCRNGAAEHSLPEEWQAYLKGLQHYEPRTMGQKAGRAVFAAVWAPWVLFMLSLRSKYAGGKTPDWLRKLTTSIFKVMWFSYDHLFYFVFGDGERTAGKNRL